MRAHETLEESYPLKQITGELYEGITGEEAPEYRPTMLRERAS